MTLLYDLMFDPAPAVREAAASGAAAVLDRFWEVVPTVTAARYVARLVDDLAFDKSSGAVRAAAVDGLALLVENALAQPLLKTVLPRLAPLLADMSPRVRSAVADLLLAVRGVRAIRFYEVVPVDTLLKALGTAPQYIPTTHSSSRHVSTPMPQLLALSHPTARGCVALCAAAAHSCPPPCGLPAASGDPQLGRKITRLLQPSYFPVGASIEVRPYNFSF